MAVPADTTNVMIDATAPVSPVVLRLGDGTTRTVSGRRVFAATAVSAANGNAVFNFGTAFAALPVVSVAVETGNTNATEARVTALSTTSCTVNVRQAPGIVILGISVLQVPSPLAGATVHLIAVEAGTT